MLNASVLDRYPKVDIAAVQALLEEKCREDRHKIIVLDDDPTGVQTVHDISVYTDWSYDSIKSCWPGQRKSTGTGLLTGKSFVPILRRAGALPLEMCIM